MEDEALLDWLREAHRHSRWTTSVCTGSLILAAAGLLPGLRATSHWLALDRLAELGAEPTTERVVEQGRIITAAGVSAGIDMALHLVSRLTDETTARRVQLALDYDPQPPLGRIDWDALPATPRLIRGALGLAAPVLVRKARRQLSSDRALAAV